jgi:hypothetical protein
MRKILLIAATGIGLALGRAGAEAIPLGDEAMAPMTTFDENSPTANSVTSAIGGRAAPAAGDHRGVAALQPVRVDRALQIDKETGAQMLVLLAIVAIAVGFGAGGGMAARILDEREFSSGGVEGQPPSGLLRANLASLDGLVTGHSPRGT